MDWFPDPVDDDPLVAAARRCACGLLEPAAADVDDGTVPRSHLDALAAAGLFGLTAPVSAGGAGAPAPVVRRVSEVLATADLATWFVQVQHHSPVRMLATSGGHAALLAELAAGRQVAGIAFSHLRRWPQRPVRAVRDGDGWRLDGAAPWYTGWGLNDVALVAGASESGEVVFGLVPAREGGGLRASAPLRLAALESTVTVGLELDGVRVPGSHVIARSPVSAWAAGDRRATVNVNPAVFGVAASALDLLADHGRRREEPEAVELAARLASRLAQVRAEAYHLIDHADPDEHAERRLALRARAQRLLVDATCAAVAAGSGAALGRRAPAQRKAREALFLLVQAQTGSARRAALADWDAGA